MNYFEIFGLPVQLRVDKSTLPRRYFELSKQYHPDYFVQQSPEVQAEALEKSAMLNKAFKTFQHPDDTIKYVLQLKGLLEEEEKYVLPPEFLMEVLEINEQLMDVRNDPGIKEGLGSRIDSLESDIFEEVKGIIDNYRDGVTTGEELLRVKEYYYKKKYLHRIRRELGAKD